MPNKEVMKLWVNELRSTNAPQTQGFCKNSNDKGDDCFCAVGILIDIFIKEKEYSDGWNIGWLNDKYENEFALWSDGIDPIIGPLIIDPLFGNCSVSHLNDEKLSSFAEIADRIEETFLKEKV